MTLSTKSFLCILLIFALSACSDDDAPTLESRLVAGTWTGWYEQVNLESGIVFSVRFNEDKTLNWYSLNNDQDGTWSVNDNQVTVNLEDGSSITGTLEGDSLKSVTSDTHWTVHDFRESGEVPSADELNGTSWAGALHDDSFNVSFQFSGNQADISVVLKYDINEGISYTHHGNGILLSDDLSHEPHAYIVFQNGKMLGSGFSFSLSDYLFRAEKQ